MKQLMALLVMLCPLTIALPAIAETLYVDAAGLCNGNIPCYTHPQDAVNAANTGDTIRVYPGIYGQRTYTFPKTPFWGTGDQNAPALIVWKDGLTIEAIDPNPASTVIQTTYNFWVNKVPIYASTGGTFTCTARTTSSYPPVPWTCKNDCTLLGCPWTCKDVNGIVITPSGYSCSAGNWSGNFVQPSDGTAPFAVAVIADNVKIRGFSIGAASSNYAAVLLGGLYAGDLQYLGADGNTVENNLFPDVFQAVFLWHSSNNKILGNKIDQASWDCSIQQYDGYTVEQVSAMPQSQNNLISGNDIEDDSGICLGAWGPALGTTWTNIGDSQVCCNILGETGFVKIEYAHGPVLIGCNAPQTLRLTTDAGGNPTTDDILQINGVTYTGDTSLWGHGPVPVYLSAALQYEGNADGSGVEVIFTVNSQQYSVNTIAGGTASTTVNLSPGNYVVGTKVTVCPGCCEYTDSDSLSIGCSLTIGYWKTHAGFGPQPNVLTPLLPVWLGTPGGTKSVEVTTAEKAVNLLSMSGNASNGINKLYAQLLAAKLNVASGADGSAIASTIAAADAFLATYNFTDWDSLKRSEKQQVLTWMTTLDKYNNGLTGPGYCSA